MDHEEDSSPVGRGDGGGVRSVDVRSDVDGGHAAERTVSIGPGGPVHGVPERGDVPLVGRYRIVARLGEGGSGSVFEAVQESPHRRVALKVLHRRHHVDELHSRLFHHEAETLARLRHPSIAAIIESGHTDDGQDFFAMELVPGATLDVWMDRQARSLDRRELELHLRLFRAICEPVHHAHQRGVIHRDLKPTNIIVSDDLTTDSRGGSLPAVKILDFGLARITDPGLDATTLMSEAGSIKGTLPYMSPEQARGDADAIDVRTDVYALGVILYELLTGTRPLEVHRTSLVDAVRTICETPPKPLRHAWQWGVRLDPDLETIVATAIAKEQDRRYGSAAALSEDIERYLESQPIAARPASAVYRTRKFVARHRAGVAASAVAVLALLAGVAGTTVGLIRARHAEARALEQAASSQRVASFLADLLSSVDVYGVGTMVTDELERQISTGARQRGVSTDDASVEVESFRSSIRGISNADLGRRVVDFAILSQAADGVRERFGSDPEVAARLELTLAETYARLGMFEPAERHARRGLEVLEAEVGRDAPESLAARAVAGRIMYRLGEYEAAEAELAEVAARQRQLVGAEDPATLRTTMWLGWVRIEQGRFEDAEAMLRPLVGSAVRVWGPDHPDTLTTMNSLAVVLTDLKRFREAEELHSRILERRSETLGPTAPDTLKSITNLGVVSFYQGRLEDAESLFRDVADIQRARLGPEHPETLSAINNLAVILERRGGLDEAEGLHREALEVKRRVLGPLHPETLSSQYNYAILLTSLGRLGEAARLHREVLDARSRLMGDRHPSTLDSMCAVAGVAARRGDATAAIRLVGRAVELGYSDADSLMADSDFESLRDDPGFLALVERARSSAAPTS